MAGRCEDTCECVRKRAKRLAHACELCEEEEKRVWACGGGSLGRGVWLRLTWVSQPPGLQCGAQIPSPAPCKQPCRNSPLESAAVWRGLAASAPGLELAGRCLIRLECVPGAGKWRAECVLVVCVCGCGLQGLSGRGLVPSPLLCGCASGHAADPGLFADSGPALWASRPFHPGFLRPGLAAEPVITPGQDAAASPALTLLGRSLGLRRALASLLLFLLLLREVGPCRVVALTINIY